MKKAIVMGASSGIGHEVAQLLIADGWTVGVAARHIDKLADLQNVAPERVVVAKIDVTDSNAETNFRQLIERIGGLNLYFHSAGIGWQNTTLDPDKEIKTMETNATAFTRMVGAAYRYFTENGGGHIACITSIAGTKGLGVAPAYSATKALQNVYIQALEQLAITKHQNICFTDIRPGFVDTPLLVGAAHFPMLMTTKYVAHRIMKAIKKHKHICVIDTRWHILTFFWQYIPNCIWRHIPLVRT